VATAAGILVVGVGGYEIASHAGGAAISSSAGSGAAQSAPVARQVSVGAPVTYQHGNSAKTIQTVTSATNFRAATLVDQAAVAVSEAKLDGVRSAPAKTTTSNLSAPANSTTAGADTLGPHASNSSKAQLAGCIDRVVAPGQVVVLVELARFENARATVIVTVPSWASGTNPPKDAEVWVVGQACSATNSDVLDHVRVARL
jgi:hypothetical protein